MIQIPLWKRLIVLLVLVVGTFYAIPSFLSDDTRQTHSWLPEDTVSLGLDLQGGSHLLLEVDIKTAMKDRLDLIAEDSRKTLRKNNVTFNGVQVQEKSLTIAFPDKMILEQAYKLLQDPSNELALTKDEGSNELTLAFTDAAVLKRSKEIVQRSREIVSRRINELGTREPNIQIQGTDRIIVQLPGVKDPGQVKKLLGKTAKLTFRILHLEYPTSDMTGGRALPGTDLLPMDDTQTKRIAKPIEYLVKKQVLLTGENLVDAQVSFDQYGKAKVSIRFDNAGGRKFTEITKTYKGYMLAIVLDDKVISAPRLNEVIPSGSADITGDFTVQEASELALLMRAGSLPAPLQVVEERTVGPDLGADSIEAGKKATVVSIIMIAVFMVVLYALFGVFANVALIFNVVLLMAALALTGSTLTLPGIAGIALTLGMAVDANVLIYERIKEELRLGRKIIPAVDAGYERAMATIMDSNLTTLIGAAALYFFGSGPIRGFGVTLAIGIIISMFTAITLTRIFAVYYIRWTKPKALSI